MPDNGVLKTVITPDPATLGTPDPGTEWRGSDATGFWIKDENDVITRPDIGTGINWSEDWTTFLASGSGATGAWTTINLGVGFENALVEILIATNGNNHTVGVRQVGSALIRSEVIDNDSTITMSVRADVNGDVQYFQSNTQVRFTITARWQ